MANNILNRPGVNKVKFAHMTKLVEDTIGGDRKAKGILESHLTTGDDSIFNLAAVTQVAVLPLFDKAPRKWTEVATTKAYPTFEGAKLYSTNAQTEGYARPVTEPGKPDNVPPVVPESSPYPHFTFKGELSQAGDLRKRGGKFSLSWEQIVNDLGNLLPQIPQLIVQDFLDAEEWEVFDALLKNATAAQQLQAGTNVDGTASVANAPLSREALIQAVTQLQNRTIDGRKVQANGGFTLIVPIGQAGTANFFINNLTLNSVQDGLLTLGVNGYNPLGSINVVESEFVTGTSWFLIPKKGSTIRPVLELMKLQGHESLDIRVEGATGNYLGGGGVGPYEGSFDTDDIAFRGRLPLRGTNWTPDLVIWSTGAGA